MKYYVYFIQQGYKEGAPVKIGVTSDLDKIMSELQTANPYPLVCKALLPCESRLHAFNLERSIHRKMSRYRMQGGWFKNKRGIINTALRRCSKDEINESLVEVSVRAKDERDAKLSELTKQNGQLRRRVKELETELQIAEDEAAEFPDVL